ncbi:MAG: Rid family hydrolase [Terracidiphilus sp.]
MRNVVCTSKAPGVGPYSQAVRCGGFIFVSGQFALDLATRQIIEGDAREQTERTIQNLAAILETSGAEAGLPKIAWWKSTLSPALYWNLSITKGMGIFSGRLRTALDE